MDGNICIEKKNKEIIQKLEEELKKINIDEVEAELPSCTNIYDLEKKVWDLVNLCNRYISKIEMYNLKLMNENYMIGNNMLSEIYNLNGMICDVRFIDNPLNQINPHVQKFYRQINDKYADKIMKIFCYSYSNDRILKVELLDRDEQLSIHLLNLYLKLFVLKVEIENMIDFLECININCL